MAAGRLLWGALQAASAGRVTALEKQVSFLEGQLQSKDAELLRVRTEQTATVKGLGDKIDLANGKTEAANVLARKAEQRMSLFLAKSMTPAQIAAIDDDDDLPSGIHQAVTVAKAAVETANPVDPFALSTFDPYAKTPTK